MKTAVSRPLSSFHQINQWKMFNAKRLGITVEEFDQRIEEKKQEYKRQQEAKAAEQAKKASEARKRRTYEESIFSGRFAGTFEEYKCKYSSHSLPRRHMLSEEEKKLYHKNWNRKRCYAAAVEKGKFSGTFEEYCQWLDRTPEEKAETQAEIHKTFRRKCYYAAAVEKGKFSGTFEEYCQHLEHLREMTPEEKAEYKAVSKKACQRRHYHKCKYQRKYQKLVDAGYEIGTLEEFSHTLEEASRLKKLMREISRAEKAA